MDPAASLRLIAALCASGYTLEISGEFWVTARTENSDREWHASNRSLEQTLIQVASQVYADAMATVTLLQPYLLDAVKAEAEAEPRPYVYVPEAANVETVQQQP